MTAEQNYRLLQEIDANRRFLLAAYRDNPALLARAEPRIRQFVDTAGGDAGEDKAQRRAECLNPTASRRP